MPSVVAQAALLALLTWLALKFAGRVYRFRTNPLSQLPCPPGGSFLLGHFRALFNVHGWELHQYLLDNYGGIVAINGPLWSKSLYVHDPLALHHILVKHQDIFEETPGFLLAARLTFGKGLFSVIGSEHRRQRRMLNPVFSTKHLRDIVPIFHDVASKLQATISQKVHEGPQEIDMLDWMSRTALELIGQSGFGYSFDPLTEGGDEHIFSVSVKSFTLLMVRLNVFRQFVLPFVHNLGPPGFRRWLIGVQPWALLKEVRDIVDVMERTGREIVDAKKRALADGGSVNDGPAGKGVGKDVMSILLKTNTEASEEDRLSDEEVVAQVAGMTFAAMDTTSRALSRILHLLSTNQEAQERLRREIRDAYEEHGTEKLGYEELASLPYLDAMCRETLRLHPPIPTVARETRADIVLPSSCPIPTDYGPTVNGIVVPKDTKVFVSILSANRSPAIWGPDALEWKPERWLAPGGLPTSVGEARVPGVYSNMMTFIAGGRACIGFKFSELEMKVVLCALISRFHFSLPTGEGKAVEWRMGVVTTPVLRGDTEGRPAMPLVVSRAPRQ